MRWDTRLALIEAALSFQENREPCLEMHPLPHCMLVDTLGYKQRMLWCVLYLQVLVNFFVKSKCKVVLMTNKYVYDKYK